MFSTSSANSISTSSYFMQIKFSEPGLCHGFALWIDWVMDEKNSIVLATGPGLYHYESLVQFQYSWCPILSSLNVWWKTTYDLCKIQDIRSHILFFLFIFILIGLLISDSRYWKQGVKLLSKPVEVNVVECFAEIEAFFEPSTGEVTIKSSFSC